MDVTESRKFTKPFYTDYTKKVWYFHNKALSENGADFLRPPRPILILKN